MREGGAGRRIRLLHRAAVAGADGHGLRHRLGGARRTPPRRRGGSPAGDTIWLCTGATAATATTRSPSSAATSSTTARTSTSPQRAVVLVFDAANWSHGADGPRLRRRRRARRRATASSRSATARSRRTPPTARPGFDGAAVRNVEVTVRDNDTPGVTIVEVAPGTTTRTARRSCSRATAQRRSPTTCWSRSRAPAAGIVVVRLDLPDGQVALSSADRASTPRRARSPSRPATLDTPVRITHPRAAGLRSRGPGVRRGSLLDAASPRPPATPSPTARVDVDVRDDDSRGRLVTAERRQHDRRARRPRRRLHDPADVGADGRRRRRDPHRRPDRRRRSAAASR